MRSNTKSSITLPPEELRIVLALQAKLKAKSKVEVVRRGLRLLRDVTEREALREAYRKASRATRASLSRELRELYHLAAEGFPSGEASARRLLLAPRAPGRVGRLQVARVAPDRRPALEPIALRLQLQPPPRAAVGAHAATDAAGALHVEVGHRVGADVDAHLAIGRAVPAGGAHVLLDRDAGAREPLHEAPPLALTAALTALPRPTAILR